VQELLRICSEAIEEVMSAKTTPENTPIPSCCDQRKPQNSTKLEKNKKNDSQIEESAK